MEEDEEEEDTMDTGMGGDQDMVSVNIMLWNKSFLYLQLHFVSY